MSDEPKADMNLDPEMLAAYIDNRLTAEQRSEVEAQLARDPDSYAVLIDTIRALDAMNMPASEVHAVPKVRRWPIVASALAVAAAVVLVVRLQPDLLQQLRGDRVDSQMHRLVAAVGDTRYFEPRLSGGFRYGPLRTPSRGANDLSEANLQLLAAAADLQKQAQQDPTPENLNAWGAAQLLLRDYDGAIASLRDAVSAAPSARAESDLAAALIARAASQRTSADLQVALDAASTALTRDSNSREALFNRAMALELLGLTEQATEAWRAYLKSDATGAWADEARAHLQRLSPTQSFVDPFAPPRENDGVDEPATGDASIDDSRTRFLAERYWLSRLCEPSFDLRSRQRVFDRLASYQRRTADSLLVESVRSANAKSCAGYRLYANGLARLELDDLVNAAEILRKSSTLLRAAADPMALWADYHLATIGNLTRDFDAADGELRRIISAATVRGYVAIEAHALWTLGVVAGTNSRFDKAFDSLAPALVRARKAHESVLEGRLENQLADMHEFIGDAGAAWPHRANALMLASRIPNRRLRHSVYGSAASVSLRRGLQFAARHFLDAQYVANRESAPAASRLTLLLRQIDADVAAGDVEAAARRINDAKNTFAELATDPRAESLGGRLRVARARYAVLSGQDQMAVDLATEALRSFDRGRDLQKADALLIRAIALQHSGQDVAAKEDIQSVLSVLRARRAGGDTVFGSPDLQGVQDSVDLVLDGAISPESAMQLADETRALLSPLAGSGRDVVAADHPTLFFKVLDSRLRAWWITSGGLVERSIPLTRADAVRLVKSVDASMAVDIPTSETNARLERAFTTLLGPFVSQFQGHDTIRIVADWPLDSLPFAALLDPATHRYVAENHAVLMAPMAGRFDGDAPAGATTDLLMVADPLRANADIALPRLAWAVKEADALSRMYSRTVVLTGASATARRLFAAAPKARIVHIAAHAVVDRVDGRRSRLLLADDHGGGDLYGEQFVRDSWRGIEVVVLAACSTAEPDSRPASPLTLASQVLAAGPKYVIATLRPVDDRMASLFFVELHRHLARGVSAPEALHLTQVQFINRGKNAAPGEAMWPIWSPVAVFGL
jgi:tetratricopeptide (TPR) repeat protein